MCLGGLRDEVRRDRFRQCTDVDAQPVRCVPWYGEGK